MGGSGKKPHSRSAIEAKQFIDFIYSSLIGLLYNMLLLKEDLFDI